MHLVFLGQYYYLNFTLVIVHNVPSLFIETNLVHF